MEILPENSLDIPPGISSVNPSRISAWILSDNDPGMPSGISSPIPLEIHFFNSSSCWFADSFRNHFENFSRN